MNGATPVVDQLDDWLVDHRHIIIDLAIGVGGVGACATLVGCLVVLGAGAAAHWGSDQIWHDENSQSLDEVAFRTAFSALAGRLCGLVFGTGCARELLRSRSFASGAFGAALAALKQQILAELAGCA